MTGSGIHVVCPSCGAINRIPRDRPAKEAKCGNCHQQLFLGKPVAANAATLRSHDPNLIFPGERIVLPPIA